MKPNLKIVWSDDTIERLLDATCTCRRLIPATSWTFQTFDDYKERKYG